MPEGTDLNTLNLALVLTGAGVTVSAALIASVIEIAKRIPGVSAIVNANAGAAATVLSAALVIYAYLATVTPEPASAFAAFLAWVGIAGMAGKTYDVAASIRAK